MKYKRFWLLFLIFIVLIIMLIAQNSMVTSYVNPHSNVESIDRSAGIVMKISRVLDAAKNLSSKEHIKYNYIFMNPYGSGYMYHNPIPNDLDMEVGIHLGTFVYDGKNGEKVAEDIMASIESFGYAFNYNLNAIYTDLYTDVSPFEFLQKMTKEHNYYKNSIKNSLDYVVAGKNYVKYVHKIFNNTKYSYRVDYPYYMSSNEILLTGYPMTKMFNDKLSYNDNQKKYLREITLIPNFFINLKYNGKNIPVEISPESFFGARLQLKRRFFASSVFANLYSIKFLHNTEILKNDNDFFFYRMLAFRRHLLEVENIYGAGLDRSIKIFKRIMQTANMIRPIIGDEEYNKIAKYVDDTLEDTDIQLLNDCSNIYGVVYSLQKAPNLLVRLNEDGKTETLYNTANDALNELYKRGNVDKQYLDVLKKYHEQSFLYLTKVKNPDDVYIVKNIEMSDTVKEVSNKAMSSLIKNKEYIAQIIKIFNDILVNAGYHRIYIYWLDEHTLGILKDDFTKGIDNLEEFSKKNDLMAIDYKLVTPAEIPKSTLKYEVWVRHNPTPEQEANYQNLRNTFLEDKKNYNIKIRYQLLPMLFRHG